MTSTIEGTAQVEDSATYGYVTCVTTQTTSGTAMRPWIATKTALHDMSPAYTHPSSRVSNGMSGDAAIMDGE